MADGGGSILSTANGGTSWTSHQESSTALDGIACGSISDCVAVGLDGSSYSSTNGGATWTSNPTASGTIGFAGISCPTPTVCIAVGSEANGRNATSTNTNGYMMATTDSGTSWKKQFSILGNDTAFNGVDCPTSTVCIAVGDSPFRSVMESTDGGSSWTKEEVPAAEGNRFYNGVACASANQCEVVGSLTPTLMTSDGANWTKQSLPPTAGNILAVACSSASACVAVGSGMNGGGLIMVHS